jgi:hypothetical protein
MGDLPESFLVSVQVRTKHAEKIYVLIFIEADICPIWYTYFKRVNTDFGPLTYFCVSFWSLNFKLYQFSPISISPFTKVVPSVSFFFFKKR